MRYVGVDPEMEGEEGEKRRVAIERGDERARRLWGGDLYGVGGELGGKRRERGWVGSEEVLKAFGEGEGKGWVRGLVEWEGGETGREVYAGWLPWDVGVGEAGCASIDMHA